jgi:hypothetical protein
LIRPLKGYLIATLFKFKYRIPKLETNSKFKFSNYQEKLGVLLNIHCLVSWV